MACLGCGAEEAKRWRGKACGKCAKAAYDLKKLGRPSIFALRAEALKNPTCKTCKATESHKWYGTTELECNACYRKANYDSDRAKARQKNWRDKDPVRAQAYNKRNRQSPAGRANKKRHKEKYHNVITAKRTARLKAWRLTHPEEAKAIRRVEASRRRANVREATPPWAQPGTPVGKILDEVLMSCPPEKRNDHILPLQSKQNKNVCGLNLPWNIAYLEPRQNEVKSASFDSTYENTGWWARYAKYLAFKKSTP